jgi:hypothetical protein
MTKALTGFPPYYHAYVSQGRHYGYVRRGTRPQVGKMIRVVAQFGTPEFSQEYERAVDALGLRESVSRHRGDNVPPDHNAARWLAVKWKDRARGLEEFGSGWFVVRICPCHFDEAVTLPCADREEAERVRGVILSSERAA